MKKSEPKLILNLQVDSEELDQKVKLAMNKYIEDVIVGNLDDEIEKIVTIEDGKFRIKIDKLSGITRMQLEKLGYKIDSDSEFFGTYDVISWDKI